MGEFSNDFRCFFYILSMMGEFSNDFRCFSKLRDQWLQFWRCCIFIESFQIYLLGFYEYRDFWTNFSRYYSLCELLAIPEWCKSLSMRDYTSVGLNHLPVMVWLFVWCVVFSSLLWVLDMCLTPCLGELLTCLVLCIYL